MIQLCNLLLSISFLLIAILHFYWSLGGKWLKHKTIPTKEPGIPLFQAGFLPCIFVSFAFIAFIIIIHADYFSMAIHTQRLLLGLILIAFLLRIIGDFRYVGLSKRVKHSVFAYMDNHYYIPICIFISLLLMFKLLTLPLA